MINEGYMWPLNEQQIRFALDMREITLYLPKIYFILHFVS